MEPQQNGATEWRGQRMLIYSWNINGFNTCDRSEGFSHMLQMEPDIICLQEVKVSEPDVLNTFYTFKYEQYYNFSSHKGHNGVFIYSKLKTLNEIAEIGMPRFDRDGRFLCLEFEDFYLVNVYMPHGRRDQGELPYKLEAYRHLENFLSGLRDKKVLVVGDFNVARSELDVERYRSNQKNVMLTTQERAAFESFLELGYKDVFRELHPGLRAYTWWPYAFNARERNVGWRIDYCLVSPPLFDMVKCIEIVHNILGSDHCPIKIELSSELNKFHKKVN